MNMSNPIQSLKRLEDLVKQASAALHKTSSENRALKEKLHRLETEHKRFKEDLRMANLTLARNERLRARLVKLSEKLERVA
jgi:methylphosphotriester-DNA--protein-cysteine methyltransferase